MTIAKLLFIFSLTLPNLVYVLFNKILFLNDDSQYARAAVGLWTTLVNHPGEWFRKAMMVHSYSPPTFYSIGQFFVPWGHVFASIDLGLLVYVWFIGLLSLYLLWVILEKLYQDYRIAIAGSLMMAATPLFMSQSRIFMLETMQLLVVLGFVYLSVTARKNDRFGLWLKLIGLVCLALSIKVSLLMFCLGPIVMIVIQLFRENGEFSGDGSRWLKRGFLLIAVLALSVFTFSWYLTNLSGQIKHLRLVLHGNELHFSYLGRVGYWLSSIQDVFFLWPVIVVFLGIFIGRLFVKKTPPVLTQQILGMSFLQILVFVIIQSVSTAGDHRFILPILPYFVLLASHCLAVLNKKSAYFCVIGILSLQFVFLCMFSLGAVPYNRSKILKYSQTAASFRVTRHLKPVTLSFDQNRLNIIGKMHDLYGFLSETENKGREEIVIDVGIRRTSFLYYAQCRIFPNVLSWNKITSFQDPNIRDLGVETLAERIFKSKPAYYIATNRGKAKGVRALVEKSGLYQRIDASAYPNLCVYQRKSVVR